MTTDAPVDIGTLITSSPDVQGGMGCVAGTRVPVRQIAVEYREGASPAEIAGQYDVPESHVHAAIAYYLVNRERIDAELVDEATLYERLRREAREASS